MEGLKNSQVPIDLPVTVCTDPKAANLAKQTRNKRASIRRLGILTGGLAISIYFLQTWFIGGIFLPVRIAGPSMAETYYGEGRRHTCSDCQFSFHCNQQYSATDAVCPNCGYQQFGQTASVIRGQRVLLLKHTSWIGTPKRWDAFAISQPPSSGRMAVKRIIGLPGETIGIKHGDIFVNGQRLQKSMRQLRKLAITVYDDAYKPQRKAPARWQPECEHTGWVCDNSTYRYSPNDHRQPLTWLVYRHIDCFTGLPNEHDRPTILDGYPSNQDLSRELQPVNDILLRCEMSIEGGGRFAVRFFRD